MSTVELPRRILRRVEKPARYVGGEWNATYKDPGNPSLTRFAFCFPDVYEIGMSNLALHILYQEINRREDAWCERVFAPWPDMEARMREDKLPLFTVESKTPLNEMDVVGFTLQYELSFTNVLNMLDLAGIPLYTSERTGQDPFVCCGGPAVFNLEPMADFFDFALIGEAEETIGDVLDAVADYRKTGRKDRQNFLLSLSAIPGVYVPSLYSCRYSEDGRLEGTDPINDAIPAVVAKRIVRDLNQLALPEHPVVPNIEIVHDRVFLELFRGCTRGCRFCQAGFVYRPVREKTPELLVRQAVATEKDTGYDEIGMLSLSTSDYPELGRLTDLLLCEMTPRRTSLSLPSLRIDSFSLDLMQKASSTRKSGLTFAPEAGTQRMRDVINKNVTEEDLLNAARLAFEGGWNSIKLYFMIGLPGETMEDVEGIAALAHAIEGEYRRLAAGTRRRRLELTVSTAVFIPKPFTPFQWEAQDHHASLTEKQQRLKNLLRSRNIRYQWHDPQVSFVEAVLARGDRRLGAAIVSAWKNGCRFDAWDEHFRYDRWMEAFRDTGIDPAFYASRLRDADEVFPWEVLNCGVRRSYLERERDRSRELQTTGECRQTCGACGAQTYRTGVCMDHG